MNYPKNESNEKVFPLYQRETNQNPLSRSCNLGAKKDVHANKTEELAVKNFVDTHTLWLSR